MDAPVRKPLTAKAKARRLAIILTNHAAWEKRTLADLRVAGFQFRTVEQAFRYWQAQKTLAAMTSDQVVEAVARFQESRRTAGHD